MNKELFIKYAEVKNKIKQLTDEAKKIEEELEIKVKVAKDPITAVVEGAGRCLEYPEIYGNVTF